MPGTNCPAGSWACRIKGDVIQVNDKEKLKWSGGGGGGRGWEIRGDENKKIKGKIKNKNIVYSCSAVNKRALL